MGRVPSWRAVCDQGGRRTPRDVCSEHRSCYLLQGTDVGKLRDVDQLAVVGRPFRLITRGDSSAEGFLHVFAVGQDRTLLHKFQFDNVTSAQPDWSPWQSLGGSMTSLPSAVIDSEGLLHISARGPDRAL